MAVSGLGLTNLPKSGLEGALGFGSPDLTPSPSALQDQMASKMCCAGLGTQDSRRVQGLAPGTLHVPASCAAAATQAWVVSGIS